MDVIPRNLKTQIFEVQVTCKGEIDMKTKFERTMQTVWNMGVWVLVCWGGFYLMKWILGDTIHNHGIIGFFAGLFVMFFGLMYYGINLRKKDEIQRQAAMDQFIADQQFDKEKQAKIDKEIIDQLRNEHKLSGTEQDRRLKALETALKHIKYKK